MPYFFSLLGTIVIITGSLTTNPVPSTPDWSFLQFDKLAHGLVYFALAFTYCYESHCGLKGGFFKVQSRKITHFMENLRISTLKYEKVGISILLAICIGTVMEFSQSAFTDHRIFEIPDLIANIIGAMVGGIVFLSISNS